jgi:hypothetical protein
MKVGKIPASTKILPAPQRGASRQAAGLTDEEIKIVEGETK